jgi:Tol biopolymer transport system component
MPDVQEVFRIATEKVHPEPGFLERHQRLEHRRSRNHRVGVFAVVAAIVVALLMVALTSMPGQHAVPAAPTPTSAPTVAGASSFVDLRSGTTTPMSDSIAAEGWAYPVSSEGTRFTYTTCCEEGGMSPDVYVSDVDGANVRRLIEGGAYGPQWSPDGSRVVFHQYNGILGDVYVVDVSTRHLERVTHLSQLTSTGGWWFTAPIFAPDGETILFHLPRFTDGEYVWDLWSVPSDGGEETLVRRNAGFGSYSPNGRMLAYLSAVDANHFDGGTLWVVDVAGGPPRALAQGGRIVWPRWSPDGTRISYAQLGTVYVVNVASGVSTPVATGGVAEWFDDDTLVVGDGN